MKKINILVVFADTQGGVGFYRSLQPHSYIGQEYSDMFEIRFITADKIDWMYFKSLEAFDIIHIHKGLFPKMDEFYKAVVHLKETNTITILDVDDLWVLPKAHPNYDINVTNKVYKIIENNLKIVDYVTTTTPLFAQKIYKINKHVTVLPNTIDSKAENFMPNKKPSDKIRFGFIMGSSHLEDVQSMGNFIKEIPDDVKDKIQIVLCGFDVRGKVTTIDTVTKRRYERPIKPEETTWYEYEKLITDNYSVLGEEYTTYLKQYKAGDYDDSNELYRRLWSRPINEYFSLYDDIDVLLAPLVDNDFNNVKSELKAIECCFSNTALIASNVGPYKLSLRNAMVNGSFDYNGQALLVNKPEQWAEYITFLANNPNYVDILKMNIHDTNCAKYDIENISKLRANFYKFITKYSN